MKNLKQFDIKKCEETIGYSFKDENMLIQCFTHSSYVNEHKGAKDNERLEFFGDAILGFVVSKFLFEKFGENDEGCLTKLKQTIVSKTPLAKASMRNGFDEFLIVGESIKRQRDVKRESLCENLFEALVAGIYIDGGMDSAQKFIYDKLLSGIDLNEEQANYKGELQEYVQKRKLGTISYEMLSVEGSANNPMFLMCVKIDDKIICSAKGRSKQKAEQICAKDALKLLQF